MIWLLLSLNLKSQLSSSFPIPLPPPYFLNMVCSQVVKTACHESKGARQVGMDSGETKTCLDVSHTQKDDNIWIRRGSRKALSCARDSCRTSGAAFAGLIVCRLRMSLRVDTTRFSKEERGGHSRTVENWFSRSVRL